MKSKESGSRRVFSVYKSQAETPLHAIKGFKRDRDVDESIGLIDYETVTEDDRDGPIPKRREKRR